MILPLLASADPTHSAAQALGLCDKSLASELAARTQAEHAFVAFVDAPHFPCVGAKSALHRQRMQFGHYSSMGDQEAARRLCTDLESFSAEFPRHSIELASFVALFAPERLDEMQFESRLWRHLQQMHDVDCQRFAWDASVSADPRNKNFSLSIGGRAFFVVGMHPDASRLARRTAVPCLVFNFHDQFERLKDQDKYAALQRAIRERDIRLQGMPNPVLARFGDASEARQYSGRVVGDEWRCPFRPAGLV
jgi:FPC/CPF motif-containing protein YcgG